MSAAQQELTRPEGGELAERQITDPMVMVQSALERGMDADQIQRFMDLADRHEAKQAKREFDEAMNRFREQCPVIVKNADGHNTKYAKLSSAIAAIREPLSDNGLSHSWRTEQADGVITVSCVVSHVGGHSEKTSLSSAPDNSGGKNSIQAIGSTVSYLERYTLFAILGIASSDQDDDGIGSSATYIGEDQMADIVGLMDELGDKLDREKFAGWLKEKGVKDGSVKFIPASMYQSIIGALERKRA